MISMNNWPTEAVKKLTAEKKDVTGRKEKAMATAVFDAIKDFCRQDPEFAQAVVQGGSFADCMKAVAKGVGNSISDLEAYKKAVAFYFPGAKIHMTMTIDLIGDATAPMPEPEPIREAQEKPSARILNLSLADFLK